MYVYVKLSFNTPEKIEFRSNKYMVRYFQQLHYGPLNRVWLGFVTSYCNLSFN